MRFLVRLLGGIWIAVLLVTFVFTWLEVRDERTRLAVDIERRATLAADAVREATERLVARKVRTGYDRILARFAREDRSVAIYDDLGGLIASSPQPKPALGVISPHVSQAIRDNGPVRAFQVIGGQATWVHVVPLTSEERPVGAAAVLVDARHLETQEWALWRRTAVRMGVLILLLTGITWLVVRWSVTHPMARMAEWTRQLKAGKAMPPPPNADETLFGPLAQEVTGLARTLVRARTAASYEAQLRLRGESVWTEERLKQFIRMRFGDRPIFVVSNREPVSHVKEGGVIRTLKPASGLVTALEPVMLACGGVWVAHGSGNADAEVGARVGLPPDDPTYALRRVWLDADEEAGYYYGFSNEGLWPLCHIVHERPQFRNTDWERYRDVNAKFTAALLEEMARIEEPVVLVQDYHFALLPRMLKAARPDARIALFWHIPWPNFEAFRICPWQQEILLGMLGADLVGFHTQFHCNNFLETVERAIEGRVEWDRFSVIRGGHTTYVQPFPISVATDLETVRLPNPEPAPNLGPEVECIGVGVERIDYTKGLPERFRAVRRFFERWPEYRRRVTFVQLASPSRSRIPRYQALQAEIRKTVEETNRALGEGGWVPIVYRERHHEPDEIGTWFRRSHFCMVTSLHDGMNLVAKEYIAARDDDDGALILSRFAGAANELGDALLVNPYDVEDMAEAIHRAVTLDVDERRSRMRRMRSHVDENNVYRWAAILLSELERMPRSSEVTV